MSSAIIASPAQQPDEAASRFTERAIERFLVHEARLLDEARFDDWLGLFTPDARYWIPTQHDQASPHDIVSLMYDDRRLLEARVRRLSSPHIHSQMPRSWTTRTVSNITLDSVTPDGRTATVRSKFWIMESREEKTRLLAGTYWHTLIYSEVVPDVMSGTDMRIAMKRVDLVNCDASLDALVVPL